MDGDIIRALSLSSNNQVKILSKTMDIDTVVNVENIAGEDKYRIVVNICY